MRKPQSAHSLGLGHPANDHVEMSGAEIAQKPAAGSGFDPQHRMGRNGLQPCRRGGDERTGHRRQSAEADDRPDRDALSRHRFDTLTQRHAGRLRIAQEQHTGIGQSQSPMRTGEECDAKKRLKILQPSARRRLGDRQAPRGLLQAAAACDLDEALYVAQADGRDISHRFFAYEMRKNSLFSGNFLIYP